MKKNMNLRIVVLGVGGAGCNAVNNMIKGKSTKASIKNKLDAILTSKDEHNNDSSNESEVSDSLFSGDTEELCDIEFAVCNTDIQALNESNCAKKIQLGTKTAQGLGAGSKPECGKKAAEESIDSIMEFLSDANMVIITAGMGGGTGTGAAPVIAEAAKAAGILTLGIVTKPFNFEGSHRVNVAEKGIEELQNNVDTLVIVSNQNLHSITAGNTPFVDAFGIADKFLADCISSVVNIIKNPGLINVDFADLSTVVKDRRNKAMMGSGIASGENKGAKAAATAMSNLLLDFGDFSWKNVDHVLVCITGGPNLSMDDVSDATQKINEEVSSNAHIILGATFSDNEDDSIRIFIFGTSKINESEIKKDGEEKKRKKVNANYDEDGDDNVFIGSKHYNLNEPNSEFKADYSNSKTNDKKNGWSVLNFWKKNKKSEEEVSVKNNLPDFLKDQDDQ
ncbi:cell division protein FtsZ [Candidatus Cytomitobacter indipagum]|nr:cell division protein FtsZ [Candidatus Cytomitobacter indipagum]